MIYFDSQLYWIFKDDADCFKCHLSVTYIADLLVPDFFLSGFFLQNLSHSGIYRSSRLTVMDVQTTYPPWKHSNISYQQHSSTSHHTPNSKLPHLQNTTSPAFLP